MRCPYCQARGGERIGEESPFERWRCTKCYESFFVFEGYPIHAEAVAAIAMGQIRCPACGSTDTAGIPDAPALGVARAIRCADCSAVFPAFPVATSKDSGEPTAFVPVHPQAMMEAVTGVDQLPTLFALTERLREYLERADLSIIHTDDKVDLTVAVGRGRSSEDTGCTVQPDI